MTNRLAIGATTDRLESFPDFPPRDDMQNFFQLYEEGHPAMLIRFLGNRDSTVVLCEAPVNRFPGRNARIPDLTIAFQVAAEQARIRNGYSIEDMGKPPDFVLEVASPSTARNDYTSKRVDYANLGIPEYWRFDPSGGQWHDAPMAGDRLVAGTYQPIEILGDTESGLWGRSEVLGLDLCWQNGKLRWWNPKTGAYLETFEETANDRFAERQARLAEQQARLAAEARIAELEAELRRRQES